MEFDWETFLAAYQSASEEKKTLIDSGHIAKYVNEQDFARSLSDFMINTLVIALSHKAVNATPTEKIISILDKKGFPDSSSFIEKFSDYVRTIDLSETNNTENKRNDSNDTKLSSSDVQNSLQSEITEIENAVSKLEPLRTMSEDMRTDQDADSVYSSSQEDLLSRKQKSSSGPRWDTDTDQ